MRRALVLTATRAEYGLLRPLMARLRDDPDYDFRLVVTGTHLAPEFGRTIDRIVEDGFIVDERIDMLVCGDSAAAVAKSNALLSLGFADALQRQDPDFIVILGDRSELLGVAGAAVVFGIPVVHIHGGEITQGAIDDAFRHALSKLSHLHFTATEDYRRRVVQLGEQPERVHSVGAIGLDSIRDLKLLDREALAHSIGFDLTDPYYLVTFHPVTTGASANEAAEVVDTLFEALIAMPGINTLVTHANADQGGHAINRRIEDWAGRHPNRVSSHVSLGQLRYLSAMRHAHAVVGNSSSGIIEAPSFGVATLDIRPRQDGRTRARSVVDCEPTGKAIREGLLRIEDPAFRRDLPTIENPYGDGHTVDRIMSILARTEFGRRTAKVFHDIP